MFPFTPIEIHSKWLVGKERILTCVSGDFYFEPVENDNGQTCGIKIACCGDNGLDSILKALGFALQALGDQCEGIDD